MNEVEVNINEIYNLSKNILVSYGITEEEAKATVNSLLDAELSGVSSHGLMRLKSYAQRIEAGVINVKPDIRIDKDLDSVLLIDGDNGLGQVVAHKTLKICFDKLENNSSVTAVVKNSNHFGTTAFYSKQVADKGYLSIISSNAGPTMAPWGGYEPLLGTNPLGASFPAENSNFVLDIASSASAKGKIRAIKNKGESIPKGWALDHQGYDTEDPEQAINGTMLPIGNHKGYGLSMMIDSLCAGLSGASLSYETVSVGSAKRNANIGHFFYIINIDDLIPLDNFQTRMGDWFQNLKNSKTREGFEEIYIPGEIEDNRKKNVKDIICLDEIVYEGILNLATQRQV
ncbi:Ldh family oxidoreductase [Aquibacillus sediminis]|uniref:Ldh family oxidoreductase n=1 Tax=Aquibacillus sediminis TaxID=2574734 RepID=UPI001107E880|nr:Ldh family oxidoreductase [Aquibacillus sediminis]